MLKVENINVFYGDLQVLWGVSFEVREGEILVLVGANGAGKSTTLKTISGILKPKIGSIHFKGARLDLLPADKVISHGVVHVPEARRLFREMTVEENLVMGSRAPQAKKKRAETMAWVYELFPRMKERRKQLAGTMSGGEQQMAAIGRGLMPLPKLLMFDEPSLGLAQGWLVEHEQLRKGHQTPPDRRHLLLSAAHRPRQLLAAFLHPREELIDPRHRFRALFFRLGGARPHDEVLLDGHLPEQASRLRDVYHPVGDHLVRGQQVEAGPLEMDAADF